MNKTKKQKAFNISLTFGVLALLFTCIFASFFVDTPNVLAYVESSYNCSLISTNKRYFGSGFSDENMLYDFYYNDVSRRACFVYFYHFTHSVDFDSFIFTFCNYNGIFDFVLEYDVTNFSLNTSIDENPNVLSSYFNSLGSMANFSRPNNEMRSYFSNYDSTYRSGYGTYLINFNSSQEIYQEGYLALYVDFTFSNMDVSTWNTFKALVAYDDNLLHTGVIIVPEVGSIESEGSYEAGYRKGVEYGKSYANQAQYDDGYRDGVKAGGNIGSWLAGIGEAPLTLIKSLFNIEIFGINLNTIVFSLLGALVVIKLIRLFI